MFQRKLVKDLYRMFPGCIILKNDPNYIQGIPDILILWGRRWAALECKKSQTAIHGVNQGHYVSVMNKMSFAAFIYPENRGLVLDALQRALKPPRPTRVSRPK
jgi:hypothetical protein